MPKLIHSCKDCLPSLQSSIADAQEQLQDLSVSLYSMDQTEILKEITDTGVMMSGYMMMYYYEMYTPQEVRDEVVRRMNALNTGELREYSRNQMIEVCRCYTCQNLCKESRNQMMQVC